MTNARGPERSSSTTVLNPTPNQLGVCGRLSRANSTPAALSPGAGTGESSAANGSPTLSGDAA